MKNTKIKNKFKNSLSIKRRGFSLLELVIIIAIMSIMTGATLAFIGNNKNNTELNAATSEVISVLRETQNYALTGRKAGTNKCVEYKIEATTGTSSYSMTGLDKDGGDCDFNINHRLSGGVLFQGNMDILFTAPHAKVGNHCIILRKNGNAAYVSVNSAGLIKRKDVCP